MNSDHLLFDKVQRRPGELLQGVVFDKYHDRSRANRVHMHRRNTLMGLSRGELEYIAPNTQEFSRRGYWLVLKYSMSSARYQVLHFSDDGGQHVGWINVGELEEADCFVSVRQVNGREKGRVKS